MPNTSGDPVPAIAEGKATGETAALYADIRATLGVPVVNLIWRHLATFPGGLSWAWNSLKPLYASGAIAAEAAALRQGLNVPALAGLTRPTLASAGLSNDDLAQINMIMQSYERSNAMNIVAHGTLLAQMEGAAAATGEIAPRLQNEEPIDGEMPELLTLQVMAPPVRALVEDLNRIGGRADILASMYRHLAHWPAFLALMHVLIAPLEAEDRLEPVIDYAICDACSRASRIADGLASIEVAPDLDVQANMQAALARFVRGPIGKMVAIVPLIRQAMPK